MGKKLGRGHPPDEPRGVGPGRLPDNNRRMKMSESSLDNPNVRNQRTTLFLVANGAVSATSSQNLYEMAWDKGIKPLNERKLKTGYGRKCGRRGRSPRRCN